MLNNIEKSQKQTTFWTVEDMNNELNFDFELKNWNDDYASEVNAECWFEFKLMMADDGVASVLPESAKQKWKFQRNRLEIKTLQNN